MESTPSHCDTGVFKAITTSGHTGRFGKYALKKKQFLRDNFHLTCNVNV